jgi:hypothetical protein
MPAVTSTAAASASVECEEYRGFNLIVPMTRPLRPLAAFPLF